MDRTMSNSPNLQEFEYLQTIYTQTCEAFERGEMTSTSARELIVGLRHTDQSGTTWKVDTTRSGRRAAFVRMDGLSGFEKLDHQYRKICAAFDRGELPSTEARLEVLALQFTDTKGRTWRIDTQRSGKSAAFIQDFDNHAPQPIPQIAPVVEYHPPLEQVSVEYEEDDTASDSSHELRIKELLVAVATIVVGLAMLLGFNSGNGSSTATTIASTIATPLPTIPTNTAITYPRLTSFANRSAVPNNTEIEFGRSVLNRPLTVIRRGNPGGVRVLVVGCIHGTEFAGAAVTNLLKTMALPSNIDLWILPMLNPDGFALKTRQNANKVDLNRNFPVNWQSIGKIGYWQWSGTGPATEPEVTSMMKLGNVVQPQLTIWYHQDYFRISPGTGRDGEIRKRYANLVNLPILKIEGGSYSGTAAMWSETLNKENTTSMTVEFGKGLRDGEAQANANAIATVIGEFFPT